jgi:hypothetical protein
VDQAVTPTTWGDSMPSKRPDVTRGVRRRVEVQIAVPATIPRAVEPIDQAVTRTTSRAVLQPTSLLLLRICGDRRGLVQIAPWSTGLDLHRLLCSKFPMRAQTFWSALGPRPIHMNRSLTSYQLCDHDVIEIHLSLRGGVEEHPPMACGLRGSPFGLLHAPGCLRLVTDGVSEHDALHLALTCRMFRDLLWARFPIRPAGDPWEGKRIRTRVPADTGHLCAGPAGCATTPTPEATTTLITHLAGPQAMVDGLTSCPDSRWLGPQALGPCSQAGYGSLAPGPMAQSLLTTNSLSQKCTKKAKIEIDFF